MRPPLRIHFVSQVGEGIGLPVALSGERGAGGSDEVGACETVRLDFGAKLSEFGDEPGGVGQGVVQVLPQSRQRRDRFRDDDHDFTSGDVAELGLLKVNSAELRSIGH
jgi:hypothetical protein